MTPPRSPWNTVAASANPVAAATAALPASTLVRREVWTKTTKGQLAVRKLLVWQTCCRVTVKKAGE